MCQQCGNPEHVAWDPIDIAMPAPDSVDGKVLKPETIARIAQINALLESDVIDSPGDSGI